MGPFRLVQEIERCHDAVGDQLPIERQRQLGAVSPGGRRGDVIKPFGVGFQREGQTKRRRLPVKKPGTPLM
jgi:hypothetical protein